MIKQKKWNAAFTMQMGQFQKIIYRGRQTFIVDDPEYRDLLVSLGTFRNGRIVQKEIEAITAGLGPLTGTDGIAIPIPAGKKEKLDALSDELKKFPTDDVMCYSGRATIHCECGLVIDRDGICSFDDAKICAECSKIINGEFI